MIFDAWLRFSLLASLRSANLSQINGDNYGSFSTQGLSFASLGHFERNLTQVESFSMNRLLHPRTLSRIQKQKVSSGGSSGGGGGVKLILGVAAGAVGGNWVYKNYVKGPESSGKSKFCEKA